MKKLKLKENQKLLIGGVFLFIAMLAIVGYTYSFFQIEDKDTGTIIGMVASASLEIEVNKLAPSTNKGLVPQLDDYITAAVVGRNNLNCVDDNSNEVCQVYSIKVTNTGSSSINVDGLVELNANNNPNLKWAEISTYSQGMTTRPELKSDVKTHSETDLTTNELYEVGDIKTYYIVVWISETNYVQADTGEFTGVVTFRNHHDVDKAFATLTSLGLASDYVGSVDTYPGMFNIDFTIKQSPMQCVYNDTIVMSLNPSRENCNTIYRANTQDGSVMYADGYSFNLMAIYEGAGIWDSSNSICLYNGTSVFDFNQVPITSEENCGTVYNLKPYVGQDFHVSMFELLEGEKGFYIGSAIYSMKDDLGTSYFFRGNIENNYVKFGKNKNNQDMYWRIVRINGDGTIRIVYDGTEAHVNEDMSTDRLIAEVAFNEISNSHGHAGYMYGSTLGKTYELEHSNEINSTIKTYLEGEPTSENTGWYYENIKATGYDEYIADAIYCNDRSLFSGTGVGTDDTFYAAYNRLNHNTNLTPTLTCARQEDRFTKGTAIDNVSGNSKLKYPIGLLTGDELRMSVLIVLMSNDDLYEYSECSYIVDSLNMTPQYSGKGIVTFYGMEGGTFDSASYPRGVKPVISLKADALKYGTGVIGDEFRISE